MPAVPFSRRTAPSTSAAPRVFFRRTRGAEISFWLLTILTVVGLRGWVAAALPTYVWTRDSGSYLTSAIAWLNGNPWVTSARRGPLYSLFLATVFGAGGTLKTVADTQAVLGAATTLLTVAAARFWLGRRALLPLAVCTAFYVCYGMPLELERLIRNETVLVFLATVAFGAWFCALRTGASGWIALSGLFAGLLQLLKGIFPVFPLIVLGIIVWNWRGRPRQAVRLAAVFVGLFLLPLVASKSYSRLSGTARPPEPEDGQMFYGRTAQWTYLGSDGILPDLKMRIRDQARDYADRYRRTGKLDNNEIVKRTVIPTLKTVIVDERGGTLVEVNRVGWQLGLEAVRHHPGAYLKQFAGDLFRLNFIAAQRMIPFEAKQLEGAGRDARVYATAPDRSDSLTTRVFDLAGSRTVLQAGAGHESGLQRYARFITALGRLRLLSPVFLTTLLLPCLTWMTRGRHRLFWVGNLLLWFYYLVLLSTVGRPLDRYLMPTVPVMFWTISTAAALAWQRWQARTAGTLHPTQTGGQTA